MSRAFSLFISRIYGDILVFGATSEEHDEALSHVLQLWREHGLPLSLKKSRFNLRAVKFFRKRTGQQGRAAQADASEGRSKIKSSALFYNTWKLVIKDGQP